MDQTADKSALENEVRAIEAYLGHPISKRIFADSQTEQESLIRLILDISVTNIETFLAREQALGHLRGLRRARAIVDDDLEDIKQKLKELQ
jgi:hypothetical protein